MHAHAKATQKPAVTPVPTGLLQCKCTCGGTPGPDGECAACRQKRLALQRRSMSTHQTAPSTIPPIVHDVLHSSGQPLEPGTRSMMESRFGHDFKRVRIHTDAQAAKSTQAVNALAYTVGQDVVFGAGQYSPTTNAGQRLLAHELTHVVQQRHISPNLQKLSLDETSMSHYEREANEVGQKVALGQSFSMTQEVSSPVLQKQVIVQEPAGGCGICHGPQTAGSIAHALIQEEFEILHPLGLIEFPFSSPTDENGRLDLAVATPTGIKIGEIKPANPEGYVRGAADMAFYLEAVRAVYPNSRVEPLTEILPPEVTIFPNPQVPSCPQQVLFVNPPVAGVYGYYCLPGYSQLVGNPNCRCDRGRGRPIPVPVPVPVPVPETRPEQPRVPITPPVPIPVPGIPPVINPVPAQRSTTQKIADFIRQVVQSGEDAEAAASRFLAENPEVRYVLIGAGVLIILATIAEDIATLGAGILDDPPTIAAALALIRVAQAGR